MKFIDIIAKQKQIIMEKILSLAVSCLMIAGMSSCTKEYNCTCTTTTTYTSSNEALIPSSPVEVTAETTVITAKKSESEDKCKMLAIDYGGPVSITDSLPTGFDANFNIIWESITQTFETVESCKI